MSGVEAAGFVLSALPILISALEYYKEGMHPIKLFLQKPYELDRFYRALDEQKTFLRLSLFELFGQESERLSQAQLEALQDDSNDLELLWGDEALQKAVEMRLGLAFKPYMSNIGTMKEALGKLVNQKCLRLESATKTDRSSLEALIRMNKTKPNWNTREIGDRIRFSSSEKKRLRLLREIDDSNSRLQSLMAQSQRIAPIVKTWKRRRTDRYHRVRTYAASLHRALASVCGCTCSCLNYQVSLQLPRIKAEKRDTLLDITFHLVLSVHISDRSIASSHVWNWQEIAVLIHPTNQNAAPRRVGFNIPTNLGDSLGNASATSAAEIETLCGAITDARASGQCLGFYLDENDRLKGSFLLPQTWVTSNTRNLVSLSSFLSHPISSIPTAADDSQRLSMKERLELAVELASGLLQLHATPWLHQRWNKTDILFLKNTIQPNPHPIQRFRPVDIKQPLVSKGFQPDSQPQLNTSANATLRHPNPTLLDLGILLLELYFGQSIEQKRQPEDLNAEGNTHNNTDLYTARNWLDETFQLSMSPRFWSATKHCIDIHAFDPMPRNPDLCDEGFREAFYEKVVLPLEEELDNWERAI
ncbi:hypothetical protein N431DRAFT_470609 [Stipitochalara longipes BDJ]|nr:hypothetical protein N431DRAFT_470609 [Stipitochalara longipes BDJ]